MISKQNGLLALVFELLQRPLETRQLRLLLLQCHQLCVLVGRALFDLQYAIENPVLMLAFGLIVSQELPDYSKH